MLSQLRSMTILGKKALFTDSRIQRHLIPEALFAYELREYENDQDYDENDEPLPPTLSISKSVTVNFYGTILVKERLSGPEAGETMLGDDDWGFLDCEMPTHKAIEWLATPYFHL